MMSKKMFVSTLLSGFMCLAAVLTLWMTPDVKVDVKPEAFDLQLVVPESFAGWTVDPNIVPLQLSEDVRKGIENLYSQTLVRTYINRSGERVMLSVAYGGDQSGNLALHKPEHCYGAQGFDISQFTRDEMRSSVGNFPVTRLLAVQNSRYEPITYWTTVGDKTVKNGLEQKLQKLRYAVTGKIPDGMLVRVSTINRDSVESYRQQNKFIDDMLKAVSPADRLRIVGKLGD